MTRIWSDWEPWEYQKVDPYSDFFNDLQGESEFSMGRFGKDLSVPDLDDLLEKYAEKARALIDGGVVAEQGNEVAVDRRSHRSDFADLVRNFARSTRLRPKIPIWAGKNYKDGEDWLPDVSPDHAPPKGSVVVGVIDRAIALHHRSQRFLEGRTRLLGAWQQIADQDLADELGTETTQPPFGLALLNPDIDKALDESKLDRTKPDIDADVFNQAVGQRDFEHPLGHRELSRAVAHGTHVLDAATGVFADGKDPNDVQFRECVRPLVVNLPGRGTVGLSSRNLSYFTILGILWMTYVADSYWFAAHGDGATEDEPNGYPMVINLSFAKQAGARDGSDDVSRVLIALNKFRAKNNLHPVYLSLPAGNDNLEQGNASILMPSATSNHQPERVLELRISPEDQSSNYVEFWFESDDLNAPPEVTVQLTDPHGNQSELRGLAAGRKTSLGDPGNRRTHIARIYYETREPLVEDGESPLKRYVVCVLPTKLHRVETPEAPSGIWKLTFKNRSRNPVYVTANIQTDQSEQPGSTQSRTARFDDPDYHRFHPETGQLRDAYNYPDHNGSGRFPPSRKRKDYDRKLPPYTSSSQPSPSKVQRHGTMNSIGNFRTTFDKDGQYHPGSSIAGGYRLSDGKPAPYSSTGIGRRVYEGGRGVGAPLVAFPSDDGHAHTGRLAAGSSDGSIRSMQGTSFSVAQLTRLMAEILLRDQAQQDRNFELRNELFEIAEKNELSPRRYNKFADPEKVGAGRLEMTPRTRVKRT